LWLSSFMENSNTHMIRLLVTQIETHLGWGSGSTWSNSDFEALSERILEATKKRLSVTTLKRIWGRAERVANPSAATLNILSQFIGFTDWREFKKTQTAVDSKEFKREVPWQKILAVIGVLTIAIAILSLNWPQKEDINTSSVSYNGTDFYLKSRTIAKGLPNSVVFEYKASAANDGAEIEIQQDWDPGKRIEVERGDSVATCIYHRPGFFNAKLMVDGSVVAREDVFIPTDGWLGVIERDSIPLYLEENVILKDGLLGVDSTVLKSYRLDPRTSDVSIGFYQMNDFGPISIQDFNFSIDLQNTTPQNSSGCHRAQVYLIYEGGAVGVPLSNQGCVATLNMMAFGQYIDGKKTDLSGFGVDFERPVNLGLQSRNGQMQVLVNGQMAYQMPVPDESVLIKGFSIHFEGTGVVQKVHLQGNDQTSFLFP